jgi:hypothetical protein
MKKLILFSLIIGTFFCLNSCFDDDPVSPTKTSFWKLTGKQYWWTPRNDLNQFGDLVQIAAIPYGTWFHITGVSYYVGGLEYKFVCVDSTHNDHSTKTHNFLWGFLPDKMIADSLYPVSGEVNGPWSGGVVISNPGDYTSNHPSFTNDWVINTSIHSGKLTGKVKIPKPPDINNPKKMAILVGIACAYANINYIYIYEWVTE